MDNNKAIESNQLVDENVLIVPLDDDKIYTAILFELFVDSEFVYNATVQIPLRGSEHTTVLETRLGLGYETNNTY